MTSSSANPQSASPVDPSFVVFDQPTAAELQADDAWWAIYREAFPPQEREPQSVIVESVRNGSALAVRARTRGVTIGLADVHLLHDPPTLFLVYLGIAAHVRGRGFGTSLLDQAWAAGAARLRERGWAPRGMVWEVDLPALALTADERRRRERRIAFFARCGAMPLSCEYRQPPLGDGQRPLPMQLLYRANQPGAALEAAAIDTLVRAVYFEKYMHANGIAPEVLHRLLTSSQREGASGTAMRKRETGEPNH